MSKRGEERECVFGAVREREREAVEEKFIFHMPQQLLHAELICVPHAAQSGKEAKSQPLA